MSRNNRSQLMQITLQLHPFLLIQKNVNTSKQAASKQRDFSPSHFFLPTLRLISMLSHVYLAAPPRLSRSSSVYLCVFTSIPLSIYTFMYIFHLSIPLSINTFMYIFHLSIPLSIYTFIISSIYLYLSLSIPTCISSIYLYLSLSIPSCISSIYLYLSQSIPTCISSIYLYLSLVHTSFHLPTSIPLFLYLPSL